MNLNDFLSINEKKMKKHIFVFISLLLTQIVFCQDLQYNESDINVYINNTEIIGPIYTREGEIHINTDDPTVHGFYPITLVYIKLVNIFPLIETEISIRNNINNRFKLLVENTDFTDEDQKNILFNYIIGELNKIRNLIVINNEYYIDVMKLTSLFNNISIISSNIENNRINVYLRDFEY